MPELQQALFTVGSNMYQQAGGAEAPGAELLVLKLLVLVQMRVLLVVMM